MLDLGSGGGLPGIPLKVLFPRIHVTLLDSIDKKIRELEHIISELALEGLRAVRARAEDLPAIVGEDAGFDAVIARAVAPLRQLAEWSLPLLTPGGRDLEASGNKIVVPRGALIAFKGGDTRKEIDEVRRRHRVRSIHEIPLVFDGSEEVSLTDKKIVLVQFAS